MVPTSEGGQGPTKKAEAAPHRYSEPREKRKRARKEPTRKSPRLHKTKDSPVEANMESEDKFGYEEPNPDRVYGLGFPNQSENDIEEVESPIVQIQESPTPLDVNLTLLGIDELIQITTSSG